MSTLCGADHERAPRCLHDVVGYCRKVVDLQNAPDLNEQALKQPEITAGDPSDGSDRLRVGEVGFVERQAEPAPVAREDESKLVALQGAVVMREAYSAVGRRQLIWWVWQGRSSYLTRKRRYIPCDNFGHQSPKDRLVTGAFHGFVEIKRYRGPRPGDELVCISTIAANRPAMEGQK